MAKSNSIVITAVERQMPNYFKSATDNRAAITKDNWPLATVKWFRIHSTFKDYTGWVVSSFSRERKIEIA